MELGASLNAEAPFGTQVCTNGRTVHRLGVYGRGGKVTPWSPVSHCCSGGPVPRHSHAEPAPKARRERAQTPPHRLKLGR
jgi:hypothetical protein